MVICDFRGSFFHSVIVSDTGPSSLNRPCCRAASAAIPQKLFVPLKIGHRLLADPAFAYRSKIVLPFCITRIALPCLFSEYFAARAQSAGWIAAYVMVDFAKRNQTTIWV